MLTPSFLRTTRPYSLIAITCCLLLTAGGCQKLPDNNVHVPVAKPTAPAKKQTDATPESPSEKESAEHINTTDMLEQLNLTRLHLAKFNREQSQQAIDTALKILHSQKNAQKVLSKPVAELSFKRLGFAITPLYTELGEGENRFDKLEKTLKTLNVEQVTPTDFTIACSAGKPSKKKIETALGESKKSLSVVNMEKPSTSFNLADKAIEELYNTWKMTPCKDERFNARYYLHATNLFIEWTHFDLARKTLTLAQTHIKNMKTQAAAKGHIEGDNFAPYDQYATLLKTLLDEKDPGTIKTLKKEMVELLGGL